MFLKTLIFNFTTHWFNRNGIFMVNTAAKFKTEPKMARVHVGFVLFHTRRGPKVMFVNPSNCGYISEISVFIILSLYIYTYICIQICIYITFIIPFESHLNPHDVWWHSIFSWQNLKSPFWGLNHFPVGGFKHFWFSISYMGSSFPLTFIFFKSYFSRWLKPPTRW